MIAPLLTIDSKDIRSYVLPVPAKSGTGFSSLKSTNEHIRALRGFFVLNALAYLFNGGLGRGAERLAGFVSDRSANPAQFTTQCLAALSGDLLKITNEAAIMATTPNHAQLKKSCSH